MSPTTKEPWRLQAHDKASCFVRVVALAMPIDFPDDATRAVAFQPVSESGYFTFTVARPFASVFIRLPKNRGQIRANLHGGFSATGGLRGHLGIECPIVLRLQRHTSHRSCWGGHFTPAPQAIATTTASPLSPPTLPLGSEIENLPISVMAEAPSS